MFTRVLKRAMRQVQSGVRGRALSHVLEAPRCRTTIRKQTAAPLVAASVHEALPRVPPEEMHHVPPALVELNPALDPEVVGLRIEGAVEAGHVSAPVAFISGEVRGDHA